MMMCIISNQINDKLLHLCPFTQSNKFTLTKSVTSLRHTFFSYQTSSEFFSFFGFIGEDNTTNSINMYLQKHKFISISNFNETITLQQEVKESGIFGNQVSCYQSNSGLIYCSFLSKYERLYFNVVKYDINLERRKLLCFESNVYDENNFLPIISTKKSASDITDNNYYDKISRQLKIKFNKDYLDYNQEMINKRKSPSNANKMPYIKTNNELTLPIGGISNPNYYNLGESKLSSNPIVNPGNRAQIFNQFRTHKLKSEFVF